MSELLHDSPTSGSPDGKIHHKMDESHVEKVTTVDIQYDIDPVREKRLTRKFDLHILPWLFGIWQVDQLTSKGPGRG